METYDGAENCCLSWWTSSKILLDTTHTRYWHIVIQQSLTGIAKDEWLRVYKPDAPDFINLSARGKVHHAMAMLIRLFDFTSKQQLSHQLDTCKQQVHESVLQYRARIFALWEKLEALGSQFSDQDKLERFCWHLRDYSLIQPFRPRTLADAVQLAKELEAQREFSRPTPVMGVTRDWQNRQGRRPQRGRRNGRLQGRGRYPDFQRHHHDVFFDDCHDDYDEHEDFESDSYDYDSQAYYDNHERKYRDAPRRHQQDFDKSSSRRFVAAAVPQPQPSTLKHIPTPALPAQHDASTPTLVAAPGGGYRLACSVWPWSPSA